MAAKSRTSASVSRSSGRPGSGLIDSWKDTLSVTLFLFSYREKVRLMSPGKAEGRLAALTTRATPFSTFRWLYDRVPSMCGWDACIFTTKVRSS